MRSGAPRACHSRAPGRHARRRGAPAATMAAEFVVCSDENRVSALGADTMVRLMLFRGNLGARRLQYRPSNALFLEGFTVFR